MRILVCGSRSWTDYARLKSILAQHGGESAGDMPDVVVIDGGARGADAMAYKAAIELRYGSERYFADWTRYGKSAGLRRNERMLKEGHPDLVLAFWDYKSSGTRHMIKLAIGAGVHTVVIKA